MSEFKHQTFGMWVTVSPEELDRPRIVRGPWWRDMLVSVGLLRPIYGETLREHTKRMQQEQARAMRRAMETRLFGDDKGA